MSITEASISDCLDRLDLSPSARAYIEQALTTPPSRRVASHGMRNTVWRFASRKMGCTISSESSLENDFVSCAEYDSQVLAVWDQPPSVSLLIEQPKGRRRTLYTPDFLVLYDDRVEVLQVKPWEKCRELAGDMPHRWCIEEGLPIDIAARAHFDSVGLRHRVITERDINPVRAENCRWLVRIKSARTLRNIGRLAERAVRLLDRERALTLSELAQRLGLADMSPLLRLIAEEIIAADIDRTRLATPTRVWVAATAQCLGEVLAAHPVVGLPSSAEVIPDYTATEALVASERLKCLRGDAPPLVSQRTLRRWRRNWQKGGQSFGALVPRRRSGNRTPRITPMERALVMDVLRRHHLSPLAPTLEASFREYLLVHKEAVRARKLVCTARPVSRKTFRNVSRSLDPEMKARARGGTRQANAAASPVPPRGRSPLPLRPFERVHIDHYNCDLHVVVADDPSIETKRPWLTAARDQATGMVLAISLSFRAPSIRSCHAVLRDLVRRHQRLPEVIVVDNGAEFDSTYFEVLLARYGVSKHSRPPGAPRFGATIESAFRSLKEHLNALPGNTSNDARARSASSTHKGQKHARFELKNAYLAIESFFFDHFNKHPVRTAKQSPERLFLDALARFSCSGVIVKPDLSWMAASAVPLERRLKYDPQRGVRHLDKWFYSPHLRQAKAGDRLEAFFEPWDPDLIYVRIGRSMVPCVHGTEGGESRTYDVVKVLEQIQHEELTDVRSRLALARSCSAGKLARRAVQRKAVEERKPPACPRRKQLADVKVPPPPYPATWRR